MSSSVDLHHVFLKEGLSQNWELSNSARLPGSKDHGCSCLHTNSTEVLGKPSYQPGIYMRGGHLNSGQPQVLVLRYNLLRQDFSQLLEISNLSKLAGQ